MQAESALSKMVFLCLIVQCEYVYNTNVFHVWICVWQQNNTHVNCLCRLLLLRMPSNVLLSHVTFTRVFMGLFLHYKILTLRCWKIK